MCSACFYVIHMTTMIQIRNVPEGLHRRLKSRAALAGMSLSDYLLGEIRQVAERPTPEELRARLDRRPAMTPPVAPARAVRAPNGIANDRPRRFGSARSAESASHTCANRTCG